MFLLLVFGGSVTNLGVRSVLLQVLEVDRDEGRRLKRCTRRSKFDEARSNVLVNRQDHITCLDFAFGAFSSHLQKILVTLLVNLFLAL